MKIYRKYIFIVSSIIAILVLVYIFKSPAKPKIEVLYTSQNLPAILPDYTNTVIPPNIAPLNFAVKENGDKFYIKIYSVKGDTIRLLTKENSIVIPIKKWKRLLRQNTGNELYFDVYIEETRGQWKRFRTITNLIANEEIDSYLVYRLINPGYILWEKMGIYKRNIQNYDESPVLVNNLAEKNCMNCHSFNRNNPDNMMFHIRGSMGGTILFKDGIIRKINTGTRYTMSAGVYPAWHPSGKLLAFSVNIINQKFYSYGHESIEVFDRASDLILYDIDANMVTTSPKVSTIHKETTPVWSPDGKYLYFTRAHKPENKQIHDSIKYDLMRIGYDIESRQWGDVDTVLAASETGLSITWPRISPDGRYLLFCMANHGYFTIHYPSSDLYLMDLETGEYNHLDINSGQVESFHSWSRNGRWFVFASKRLNDLCTRPFFCYFDSNGKTYKPFVLPQKDPGFYNTFLKNYNVPEMVADRINVNKWELSKVVQGKAINAEFDQSVDIDALSGATRIQGGQHP
ncbi:MAG: PD40 domain-containing protein [Bacteroidales bacterium]|nr:MAG: PD40 domain-containing protein [Bacteroidales bacterium]